MKDSHAFIEIHGAESLQCSGSLMIRLKEKILKSGIGGNVIIEEVRSCPYTCDSECTPYPYIKIWGDHYGELREVAEILEEIGFPKIFTVVTIFYYNKPVLSTFVEIDQREEMKLRAISLSELNAATGMFRLVVLIDSELYQVGDDVPNKEIAITMMSGLKKSSYCTILDDKGDIIV